MNWRFWPWKRAAPDAGRWGEELAESLLRRKGYRILGRRVRVGRRDELDLVARHGAVLVFVEVKTRGGTDFGRPASAVGPRKRHALSRGALHYLRQLRERPDYFRFDVVEVIGRQGEGRPDLRHIENAFPLDRCYRARW